MKISTKAMIKKDTKTFYLNKQVLTIIILLPLILCFLYPLAVSLIISFSPETLFANVMQKLGLGAHFSREDALRKFYGLFLVFVLLIPMKIGDIMGTAIVTTEKENRTLESILYSPLTTTEFFKAKLLSTLLPGIAVSFLSGLLCFLTISIVSLAGLGTFIVPTAFYSLGVVVFGPSLLFLMLTLTLRTSSRSETSIQAQQRSIFVVLPFLFLEFAIIGFLALLNDLVASLAILGISIVFFLIAFLVFNHTIDQLTSERLIQ